jgi:hypothetical protein
MGDYQLPCEVFNQTGDALSLNLKDGRLVFKTLYSSLKRYFSLNASLLVKNWEYGYPSMFERFYFNTGNGQVFVFDLFSGILK